MTLSSMEIFNFLKVEKEKNETLQNFLEVRDIVNIKEELKVVLKSELKSFGMVIDVRNELIQLSEKSAPFWATIYTVTDGIYQIDVVDLNSSYSLLHEQDDLDQTDNLEPQYKANIGQIINFDFVPIPKKETHKGFVLNHKKFKHNIFKDKIESKKEGLKLENQQGNATEVTIEVVNGEELKIITLNGEESVTNIETQIKGFDSNSILTRTVGEIINQTNKPKPNIVSKNKFFVEFDSNMILGFNLNQI